MPKNRGFTLIELLIVIAILGILAAAVLVAVNPGKRMGQSRDAQRESDLGFLKDALQTYYAVHGSYPSTVCNGNVQWYSSDPYDNFQLFVNVYNGACPDPDWRSGMSVNPNWIPGLAPGDVKILPGDPKQGKSSMSACNDPIYWGHSAYNYKSDGTQYKIITDCSIEATTWDSTFPFFDPVRAPNYFSAPAWMVCDQPPGGVACGGW